MYGAVVPRGDFVERDRVPHGLRVIAHALELDHGRVPPQDVYGHVHLRSRGGGGRDCSGQGPLRRPAPTPAPLAWAAAAHRVAPGLDGGEDPQDPARCARLDLPLGVEAAEDGVIKIFFLNLRQDVGLDLVGHRHRAAVVQLIDLQGRGEGDLQTGSGLRRESLGLRVTPTAPELPRFLTSPWLPGQDTALSSACDVFKVTFNPYFICSHLTVVRVKGDRNACVLSPGCNSC